MVSSKSKTREKKERDDIIIERQEFWYSSFALPFTHSVKWIRNCFYPFFHFLWTFHMHKIDRNDDNNTKRKRLKYFRYSFSRCIWFCGWKTVLLLFWCIHFFVKCIQRPLFCFYLFLSFLFSAINFLVVRFGLVWLSLCMCTEAKSWHFCAVIVRCSRARTQLLMYINALTLLHTFWCAYVRFKRFLFDPFSVYEHVYFLFVWRCAFWILWKNRLPGRFFFLHKCNTETERNRISEGFFMVILHLFRF